MVLEATQLEVALARALDKSPLSIRYFTTRLLAELLVGGALPTVESQRLASKVGNSFPRNKLNGGYRYWSDQPSEDNVRAGVEILRIIERSRLTFKVRK